MRRALRSSHSSFVLRISASRNLTLSATILYYPVHLTYTAYDAVLLRCVNCTHTCTSLAHTRSRASCIPCRRSHLLHAPPAVSRRLDMHEHRPGQLHVHMCARLDGHQLRDTRRRLPAPAMSQWRHVHGECDARARGRAPDSRAVRRRFIARIASFIQCVCCEIDRPA